MPIHVHPYFRAREKFEESTGVIAPLNSDGYNELENAQSQGQAPKNAPVVQTFIYNNTSFTTGTNATFD